MVETIHRLERSISNHQTTIGEGLDGWKNAFDTIQKQLNWLIEKLKGSKQANLVVVKKASASHGSLFVELLRPLCLSDDSKQRVLASLLTL